MAEPWLKPRAVWFHILWKFAQVFALWLCSMGPGWSRVSPMWLSLVFPLTVQRVVCENTLCSVTGHADVRGGTWSHCMGVAGAGAVWPALCSNPCWHGRLQRLWPNSDTALSLGSVSHHHEASLCRTFGAQQHQHGQSLERLWVLLSTGILTFKTTVLEPQGTLWLIFPFSVYNAAKVQRDNQKVRHSPTWLGNEEWTVAWRERNNDTS